MQATLAGRQPVSEPVPADARGHDHGLSSLDPRTNSSGAFGFELGLDGSRSIDARAEVLYLVHYSGSSRVAF